MDPNAKRQLVRCEAHGLTYDPELASGCTLCRRDSAQAPAARPARSRGPALIGALVIAALAVGTWSFVRHARSSASGRVATTPSANPALSLASKGDVAPEPLPELQLAEDVTAGEERPDAGVTSEQLRGLLELSKGIVATALEQANASATPRPSAAPFSMPTLRQVDYYEFRDRLSERNPALRACYELARQQKRGRLELSVVIDPDGSVQVARVSAAQAVSDEVKECFVREAKAVQFSSASEPTHYRLALSFEPPSAPEFPSLPSFPPKR